MWNINLLSMVQISTNSIALIFALVVFFKLLIYSTDKNMRREKKSEILFLWSYWRKLQKFIKKTCLCEHLNYRRNH